MNFNQILTTILRLFVAILLGWAGYLKLSSAPVEVELFTSLSMEPHGRYLVGILELGAAVLILLPQGIVQGAILAWGLMAGAILAHLTRIGIAGQAGVLFGAALVSASVIIYLNRSRVSFLNRMFNSGQEKS
jgi:putative oxidoreductase